MKSVKDFAADDTSHALTLLLKRRTGPCLSILIPFYAAQSKRKLNLDLMKGALAKASLLLECDGSSSEKKNKIRMELERFALAFDASRCGQSMGIFIAGDVTHLVFFPFEVNNLVSVADSFEVKDVLLLQQYLERRAARGGHIRQHKKGPRVLKRKNQQNESH